MRPWLSTTLLAAAICATPVPAPGQPADKASRVVFTVNNEGAPRSLDPALMGGGRPEYRLYLALFEGLVVPDPETSLPRPGLAESWTASADMKTCTFRLRPARWSDGAGIKAQDVVDSWLRTLDPATQAVHLGDMLDAIPGARDFHEGKAPRGKVGIRAVDARTFEVSFTRPMPQAPFLLLEPCFGVVPLQAVRAFGKDWARPEHFVGNGPFVLAEWDSPERIVVDRNPYYWNAAQVGLDRIAFMAIDGQDDAYDQYAAGAFDWSPGIDGRRYAEIKERRDYQCVPGSAVYYFNVNTGRKPFNDARVRKALSMALDRTRVCEQVAGTGQMPTTDFVPPMPGFQLSTGSGYDPEGARRLLAEAGFPGGKGFPKFTVTYNAYVLHEQVAEWVAAQWKEVLGIQARLESLGWDIYRMRRLAHDFDICRAGWRATLAEPTEFLRPFRRDGEDNASRYASADVDALLDRATGLPLGAARDQVLREAAQDVVDRDQAVIPLFFYPAQDLIDLDRWEGWFPNTMGVHPWTSIRRRERGAALGARPPETPAGSPPGQAYVRTMEHFYQLDPRIGTGATGLCGPTSSAMVINHFAKRHPNLKPGNTSAYDLIRAFAEAEGAGRTTGVTKGALEDKLERCIRKAGYDATIETHGVAFGTDVSFRRYDLAQVARRLQDEDTAIVVIIGGYDYDPRRNDYIRDYGHVMVLAGYDPEGLTLADPARRSGPSRYRLREVPHQDASLMDASKAYAIRRTTQGLHELVRGEEYHDIIETLIVIHVSDPKRP